MLDEGEGEAVPLKVGQKISKNEESLKVIYFELVCKTLKTSCERR